MHRLSFRVDYNRNRITGPSFSSVHQGTESLNNQNWNTTLNGYRFGLDFRVTKKTTLSYTQLLQYYNGGSTYSLNTFNSWPLSNGSTVSFGLPWFNGGSPCSAPLKNGIANPVCNGYTDYSLFQHANTSIPTEQLNLTSSSLKWLDFNGQYQYSHAHIQHAADGDLHRADNADQQPRLQHLVAARRTLVGIRLPLTFRRRSTSTTSYAGGGIPLP